MRDFTDDLRALHDRVAEAHRYLRIDAARARLAELEVAVAAPDLWDDQDRAKQLTSEYAAVKDDVDTYDALAQEMEDAEVLHELAREEGDESYEAEIDAAATALGAKLSQLELRSLFTGEHDEADAICRINAKDGGVDAQDWAEMLLRMYSRWAERRGFGVAIDDVSEGTEAGILSAEFTIRGRYAYGLMSAERGTHRLVRISPFDGNARRQTSFAAVEVWPVMDAAEVELNDADIRMEVFRASGAGGQHVNKTSSAVRLIHEPTGLIASSQEERSQLQNREKAMNRLRAMVAARAEEERELELQRIAGGKQAQVGWGSQIRNYVLQPYQMVKDLRTGVESGNVAAVLDGDIDEFMEGYLRWKRASGDGSDGGSDPGGSAAVPVSV
jgi:peptide chain release factor 2